MSELKSTFTVDSAISEFYKLKEQYKRKYYEQYVKQIVTSDMPSKYKHVQYAKLPKPNCINCSRQVGSIFNIYKNEDGIKIFEAKCGDISDPCDMKIVIHYANRYTYDESIKEEQDNIKYANIEIIKEKNRFMFYEGDTANMDTSFAMKRFEKISDMLTEYVQNLEYFIAENNDANHNLAKKQLLKTELEKFEVETIVQFKEYIKQFQETNNVKNIKEAINFYVHTMIPSIKQIQDLKYASRYIDFNKTDGTYHLIQQETTIESNEFSMLDDEIITFIMGTTKKIKNKNHTLKNTNINRLVQTYNNNKKPPLNILDTTNINELNDMIELKEDEDIINREDGKIKQKEEELEEEEEEEELEEEEEELE